MSVTSRSSSKAGRRDVACIDENAATARASVNPLLRILWRANSCSAKAQTTQRWKPLYRWGRIGASLGRSSEGFDKGGSMNKLIRVVTTAFLAVLSTAGFIGVLSIAVGLLTMLA